MVAKLHDFIDGTLNIDLRVTHVVEGVEGVHVLVRVDGAVRLPALLLELLLGLVLLLGVDEVGQGKVLVGETPKAVRIASASTLGDTVSMTLTGVPTDLHFGQVRAPDDKKVLVNELSGLHSNRSRIAVAGPFLDLLRDFIDNPVVVLQQFLLFGGVVYNRGMNTTVTNNFAGAVLVLTDSSRAEEIAARVASGYFPDSEYHYTVTESTPLNVPVDLRDQTASHQRDLGVETQVLTVYPWALTESNLTER